MTACFVYRFESVGGDGGTERRCTRAS